MSPSQFRVLTSSDSTDSNQNMQLVLIHQKCSHQTLVGFSYLVGIIVVRSNNGLSTTILVIMLRPTSRLPFPLSFLVLFNLKILHFRYQEWKLLNSLQLLNPSCPHMISKVAQFQMSKPNKFQLEHNTRCQNTQPSNKHTKQTDISYLRHNMVRLVLIRYNIHQLQTLIIS